MPGLGQHRGRAYRFAQDRRDPRTAALRIGRDQRLLALCRLPGQIARGGLVNIVTACSLGGKVASAGKPGVDYFGAFWLRENIGAVNRLHCQLGIEFRARQV